MRYKVEPLIRMSSISNCRLRTAHDIIGSNKSVGNRAQIAMMMGTYLEPMIVQILKENGVTVHFGKEHADSPQIEIETNSPRMQGHPDGLITIDSEDVHPWVEENFPPQARRILVETHRPMLLEIKTMNGDTFKKFQSGGVDNDDFTALYRGQINTYMGALKEGRLGIDPASDITNIQWTQLVDNLHDFATRRGMPDEALVVVFCPENRKFGFQVIEYNHKAYEKRKQEMQEGLLDILEAGAMPEPDYDGTEVFCFFCPYYYECPAVEDRNELREYKEGIIPQDKEDLIEEKAIRYVEIGESLKELETERRVVRGALEDLVPYIGGPIRTKNFRVSWSKGKSSYDMDEIANNLGLPKSSLPRQRGNPYSSIRKAKAS